MASFLRIPLGQIRLWLDDLRPAPLGYDVVAITAAEAIEVLRTTRVVEISLDHDLGPASAGTGYVVAAWIERAAAEGKLPQLSWHTHSMNVVGTKAMRAALESADRFWAQATNKES